MPSQRTATFDVHLHDLPEKSAIRAAKCILVTRAAWERSEFLIQRVGDSRSFPFLSSIFNYALLAHYYYFWQSIIMTCHASCYHDRHIKYRIEGTFRRVRFLWFYTRNFEVCSIQCPGKTRPRNFYRELAMIVASTKNFPHEIHPLYGSII